MSQKSPTEKTIFSVLIAFLFLFILVLSASAATVTWTGGGADTLASNPANWSGNAVPQGGDDVVFDSTSTDDCTWDINVILASLTLDLGYTGAFTLNSELAITGDLIISDGIFYQNNKNLEVGFVPISSPPTATTDPATEITDKSARLNAKVNPNGSETTVYFEWGMTGTPDKSTAQQSIGSGTDYVDVTENITNLLPSTTYYYRVVAVNDTGTTYGEVKSFTTATGPPVISVVPSQLDFGSVGVGASSSMSIDISNTGAGDLLLGTIAHPSAPFSVTSDDCSGQILSSSVSCSVTVEFTPSAEGTFTDTLTIPSNDASNSNVTVNLSGTATPTITLIGTVTDSSTALPLSNVSVTITDSLNTYSLVTDSNGKYTISGLAVGSFTAIFVKSGYLEHEVNSSLTTQIQSLDVRLTPFTFETIRPTDAYNPEGWINPTNGYDGNTSSYTYNIITRSTPSISFGGSSSNELINAWQAKSNYWYSAYLYVTLEHYYSGDTSNVDDLIEVIVTNQNGNLKHTLLPPTAFTTKKEYVQKLNMSDWGNGFDNIANLRVRVNTYKNGKSDGSEGRVYDVRIEGNTSPIIKDYTRGIYSSLPGDESNLATDYTPSEIIDVDSDDGERVSQTTSTNQYPIHQFKRKTPSQNIKITWNGQLFFSRQQAVAQSFKTINSGNLTSAKLHFYKQTPFALLEGFLKLVLKSNLNGEVLAESDLIPESSMTSCINQVTFTFNNPTYVTAGKRYYMIILREKQTSVTIYTHSWPEVFLYSVYYGEPLWVLDNGNWTPITWLNIGSSVYINNILDLGTPGAGLNLSPPCQFPTTTYDNIIGLDPLNIYLEAYNRTISSWVQLDTALYDGSKSDINLSGVVFLNDYFDNNNWIAIRVYSEPDTNINTSSFELATDLIDFSTILDDWEISVEPSTLDFGSVGIGASSSLSLTVSNIGMGDLVIGTIAGPTAPFSVMSDGCSEQTLSASSSCSVTVEFTPTAEGTFSDTLTIPSNDADNPSVTVNLSGTAITATLTGTVTDSSTGLPLSNVTVTVTDSLDTHYSAITDSNGTYMVSGLAQGSFTATFAKTGYIEQTVNDTLSAGQTMTLNVQLTPILPPPLTVIITSPEDSAVLNSSPITVTGDVYNTAGSGGYGEARAQSFKPAASGSLDAVSLILLRVGSPDDNLYVKVTTELGSEPIAISNTVPSSSIDSSSLIWKTFYFPDPPAITAGNTYYIELWREKRDENNYVEWYQVNGMTTYPLIVDYYGDGKAYHRENGVWDYCTYCDFTFKVYINNTLDILQEYWSSGIPQPGLYGLDPYPVEVTVNGIQASVSNNTFSASISLSEGPNTITATATDQYNNTATDSINVTLITKGSITGTVTDSLTGLPISSATVSVTDSLSNQQSTLTAADGTYTISDIYQGVFSGDITKAGYTTYNFSDTMSPGQTITIDAVLSPIPPTISNIAVSNITTNSATITWTTDQSSDSLVEYGETSLYGNSQYDATLTTSHSIILTGLTMGTKYHFRVTSTNALNASSTSGDNTFTTYSPISITITSPLDNETINRSDVMVKGTVTNTTGNETGVTVNGLVATVYGGEFFVNHVPLDEGSNTITANAVDTEGNTASISIIVTAVTTTPYVTLRANIESGIAPLETYFSVSTSIPNAVATYEMDYEGDGMDVDDYTGTTFEDISFTYTTEGIYYPTSL